MATFLDKDFDETRVEEGTLWVWWIPQIPMKSFKVQVPSREVGLLLMEVLAEYDRFQYDNRVKPDYCNAGGMVMFTDGDWVDVEDDDEWNDLMKRLQH